MPESVESGSLAPVAVSALPAKAGAATALRGLTVFRSVPLALSVFAHGGLAFVAAQHWPASHAELARMPLAIEVAAPDLAFDSEVAPRAMEEKEESPVPAAIHAQRLAASAIHAAVTPPAAVAAPDISSVSAEAPAPATLAPKPVLHFTMNLAAPTQATGALTQTRTTALGTGAAANDPSAKNAVEAPVSERAVDSPAKLIAGAPPAYTNAAQAAGIEADVPLEIVVNRAGGVESARALAHVGYGLDETALRAVRGYRFSAALRAGSAVAVRMRWMMRFQLR